MRIRDGGAETPKKLEEIIEEQKKIMYARESYKIENKYRKLIGILLSRDEHIVLGARQSWWRTLAPGIMLATDKRIIVMKQSFWDLWMGHNITSKSVYTNVHYNRITDTSLVNGFWLCTIILRIIGAEPVEMHGLKRREATRMIGFLERVAIAREEGQ